ncbi:MAG: 50S ribosomal protein L10 [Candidatus Terrybacteria bacterium RIFCSPHIGHO2_01_FULL_48_17]|uniref:Large ribosomal subunit protein uL10 n=1 Tax=Candidatus Terrybacteria bacterium RIFCSPHIGHO2_01_FULL_48_17 TaxID=1802362 RepID=A0A1G2PM98_9BACT|nr:MAG: 50S ribosomal protein L10 [Candidatus Terrybacteria bacterium RIFCSPHIGHO2_01_FULL_48_17]OHA53472.1 MAG: 50S ribosomal protein L10 [Candidatus Terrybacteria bacterium RIFCSPLOWO2_01_FULL_48_14]
MLTRAQKEGLVSNLADSFSKNPNIFLVNYTGVDTLGMNALRKVLKPLAQFRVVKKTLFARALRASQLSKDPVQSNAQIAIAFGFSDPVAAAKALSEFAKAHETFNILGGIVDREPLEAADIVRLALLPPREVLLGQLVGVLAGPIRNFVSVISGPQRGLVTILSKRSTT